ncbi:PBP1A family penicillin-binding protein [Thioalkalicoccus limnaeus]|uniref:Penicillin-binding protein 1A n=1 Tax=Thioalkalicoccus limnaeus TaxID=120681 RepID=A0ABV4BFT6_9GAMM
MLARSVGNPDRDHRSLCGVRRRSAGGSPRTAPGLFHWFASLTAAGLALPFTLALPLSLVAAIYLQSLVAGLPAIDGLRVHSYREPLRIYSADGALMAEFGIERRRPVPIEAIPPALIDAFLAAEDSRFFDHRGIDGSGLARAALEVLRTGRPAQGGSTITMQLTRNLFLTPEKTLRRKLSEILLAVRVEDVLSKPEILELYLNQIFFGHRAYGVSAAAEVYYGKALADLTITEMAMLAGIPKAPSTLNPVTNPARALARRDHILGRLLELGRIDEAAYRGALAEPDRARLHHQPADLTAGHVAEMVRLEMVERFGEEVYGLGLHVVTTIDAQLQDQAQAAVRRGLIAYDERHGYRGPETRLDPARSDPDDLASYLADVTDWPGMRAGIVTAVTEQGAEVFLGDGETVRLGRDAISWARPWRDQNRRGPAPRHVTDVLRVGDLIRVRPHEQAGWRLAQAPAVTGALVAMAPQSGAILALVGGYSFQESAFNRAVDARRQPGSAFKPFIYAAALDRGWTAASLVHDEPIQVPQSRGRVWQPRNADRRTLGPIRVRVALAQSRNLATIDLLERVGIDETRAFITRFGFAPETLPRGLSLALGSGEASPWRMAAGYAVFANGGFRVEPHLIQRVQTGNGHVLFEAAPRLACTDCWFRYGRGAAWTRPLGAGYAAPAGPAPRVLDPVLAFQMHSLLRSVIDEGTGQRAKALGRADIVGKTGTTNRIRDSWFAGYQKDLVAVTWMGFDDFAPLGRGEEGGRAALGIWADFMAEALDGTPEAVLDPPPGLALVWIDRQSGAETGGPGPQRIQEWLPGRGWPTPLGDADGWGQDAGSSAVSGRRSPAQLIDELF